MKETAAHNSIGNSGNITWVDCGLDDTLATLYVGWGRTDLEYLQTNTTLTSMSERVLSECLNFQLKPSRQGALENCVDWFMQLLPLGQLHSLLLKVNV